MATTLKNTIEQFTPPILFRAIRAVLRRGTQAVDDTKSGLGQKDPEWYDQSFDDNDHWKWHYTKSSYYFLWSVIADRLVRIQAKSILDVGCGSGQLAALLKDKGIERYCGIDFSPKRVAQAKRACPGFDFIQADAFRTDIFETYSYDALLATEFLEHVEGDVDIILKIRTGTRFIGTVPNFPFQSHVRHFRDTDDVATRYGPYFTDFRVDRFFSNDKGKTFFLLEGIKT
jgi:SAM-dependent methyltransferase